MILIHIIADTEDKAIEIADFLNKEKLILNSMILENVIIRKRLENGTAQSTNQTLIMGKTKALLFNTIDKKLREKFVDAMPILYSIPIINMDWEQADELIKETIPV
ncbi:hypothetical protein [Aquimarina sp. 2201CG14-23]|uniref:hypothetical protein n=1 Tax=Aquimarina mycalae TaxID=3040073 RepID=UPI002477D920|nr:hypothetical protein [Aquimarina sp. 2201CG14-23]MDH7448334.1 hypothetical protein [Aquimarina sp. 2201CG14-23]